MMRRTTKTALVAIFTLIFLCSIALPAYALDSVKKQYTPALPSATSLGNNGFARLVSTNLIPSSNGNTITAIIRFYNGSNSTLDLTDYWVRFKKKGSSQSFTAKLIPTDKNSNKIPAKTLKYIGFYTSTGSDVQLSNLQIQIIKWDFSKPNYENILGTVDVPSNTFIVPSNQKYEVQFSGLDLNTTVDKSIISKNEQNYKVTVYYTLENKGKTNVIVPALQYNIVTNDGITYPLTISGGSKELSLTPKTSQQLILKGNIPAEIKEGNWKLVVAQQIADTKELIPIATYALPKSTTTTGSDFDKVINFTDSNGLFIVKINSLNRLPLGDQDIITANMTITNKDSTSLPVPNLTGKYVLDGVVEKQAELYQPDKILGIKPNQSITVNLYTTVPYTYDFTDLKLVLQEKGETATEENSTLIEVSGSNVITATPVLSLGSIYKVNSIGSTSSFVVKTVRTYSGDSANIYSAQLDVTNLEKRFTNVIKLAAFFKAKNGTIYPASVSEVKTQMSPGGRTLLDVGAVVPKSVDLTDATLILGEAVEKTTSANNQTTTDIAAYVNPVEMKLPSEEQPNESLTDINLYPYKLSISKVRSTIEYGSGKLNVDFQYSMIKDPLVQANTENKNIVIEIRDDKNNIAFTNEYAFEKGTADNAAFSLGENEGRFTSTDSDLIFKISTLNNNFKFNVYEQIQPGQKKLLASREIRWFIQED